MRHHLTPLLVNLLLLFPLLSHPALTARADGDAPDVDPPETESETEYETKVFGEGLGSVRVPKGWTLAAERKDKAGEQWIVALPPDVDPKLPRAFYKLVIMPLPPKTPLAKRQQLTSLLMKKLRARAKGKLKDVGKARSITLDGQPMSEQRLSGKVGGVALGGRIRARTSERSLAVGEQAWPADEAERYKAIYDAIDKSLAFRFEVPKPLLWRVMLPASWSFEVGEFGANKTPSVTFAPRRLRQQRDPGEVRLITTVLIGERLAKFSPTQLADNVALNYMKGETGFREVSRGERKLGPIPGTRIVIEGPAAPGRGKRLIWVVVAKTDGASRAHLWIAIGDQQQVERAQAKLAGLMDSLQPVAPPEPEKQPEKPAEQPE